MGGRWEIGFDSYLFWMRRNLWPRETLFFSPGHPKLSREFFFLIFDDGVFFFPEPCTLWIFHGRVCRGDSLSHVSISYSRSSPFSSSSSFSTEHIGRWRRDAVNPMLGAGPTTGLCGPGIRKKRHARHIEKCTLHVYTLYGAFVDFDKKMCFNKEETHEASSRAAAMMKFSLLIWKKSFLTL